MECPQCGAPYRPDDRYCIACGAELGREAPASPTSPAAGPGPQAVATTPPSAQKGEKGVLHRHMHNQAEFIADKHGVDANALAQRQMSYYPVMAEGSATVPRFASREEAVTWVCGQLRSTHRVEKHDAYAGCPAFVGATTSNGTRVILGNVSCP